MLAAAIEATLRPAAGRLCESSRYKHLHDNHKRAETDGFMDDGFMDDGFMDDGFADHVLPPSRCDCAFKTRAN
jgi:hypothetical protein